jgi:putative spermidine/putrescine transport system substrate-binding protein
MSTKGLWAAVVACIAAFGVAACGSSDNGGSTGSASGSGLNPPKLPVQKSIGQGEGQLNIIAWAGYAEDGSTDPKVDWVTPFEKATGCQTNVKIGNTSDEMVTLMRTGNYDGVSASGNATLRLIAGGDVSPVNTALFTNYKDIWSGMKDKPWNSVNGQMYGIPHGYGANLLMWSPKAKGVSGNSWSAVFDPAQMAANKGHVTAYDDPIYIADAATYLKAHQPDLKITNPYELDQKQFDAAVNLLKTQRKYIGQYWADYTKEQAAFANGDSTVGTTWQIIANLLEADKHKVKTVLPSEGSTGWADTWMISSKAKHPNCMYKWMNWITKPDVQAQVAEWFGEAPANRAACSHTAAKDHCKIFHEGDQPYFNRVAFWTTPISSCGDSRGNKCVDYSKWVQAWTDIKG